MELYRKVEIRSENDLPKKGGDYFVQLKTGYGRILHFPFNGDVGWNIDVHDWIQNVDWYLQPYELDLLTDEEIKNYFTKEHFHYEKGRYTKVDKDRIYGAKWMKEEIKKRNNL